MFDDEHDRKIMSALEESKMKTAQTNTARLLQDVFTTPKVTHCNVLSTRITEMMQMIDGYKNLNHTFTAEGTQVVVLDEETNQVYQIDVRAI